MSKKYIVIIEDDGSSAIEPYRSPFEMITEFHQCYGQPAPKSPRLLDPAFQELRYKLHSEEAVVEYREACKAGDLVKIADALCDSVYVIVGSAVGHGFTRFDEMFLEVHASNMSKLDENGFAIIREDGKVLKGPNFFEPNLKKFL